jgi:hypothetical protein
MIRKFSLLPAQLHWLRPFFFLFGLVAGLNLTAQAQSSTAKGYQFLTVTAFESQVKVLSKIIVVPAFEGKSEIQLEDFGGFSTSKNVEKLERNTLLINQELEALTTAGWELVQVYTIGTLTTRYLFRKAK